MVLRYCLGMIMSVSTLIIWSGAATPSRVVNFCMVVSLRTRTPRGPSHGGSAGAGQVHALRRAMHRPRGGLRCAPLPRDRRSRGREFSPAAHDLGPSPAIMPRKIAAADRDDEVDQENEAYRGGDCGRGQEVIHQVVEIEGPHRSSICIDGNSYTACIGYRARSRDLAHDHDSVINVAQKTKRAAGSVRHLEVLRQSELRRQ